MERQGPVFIYEPPNKVEFLNTRGAVVDCSAHGSPEPKVSWLVKETMNVADIPKILKMHKNGSLVFSAFTSDIYMQHIHATVYHCHVGNRIGQIISRPVFIRAVVNHLYEAQVYDEYVIKGNTAVLRCQIPSYVSGYVMVTSWVRSDNYIIRPQLNNIGGRYSVFPNGQLHIRNVMPSDGHWEFWCQTKHKLSGQAVRSVTSGKLIVTESQSSVPPRINDRISSLIVKEGFTAEFPCAAQSYPLPKYRWLKFDDKKEKYLEVQLNRRIVQLSGSLFVQSARPMDSGQYKCMIENSVGSESVTIVLKVNAPLVVYIEPQNQVIAYGEQTYLNCTHSTQSEATAISWLHNGRLISDYDSSETKFAIRRLGRHSTLHVKNVHSEQEGMYQCMVKNNEDIVAQGTAQLLLGDKLPKLEAKFTSKVLNPGSSVSLECKATGTPLPKIKWFFNNYSVLSKDNIIIMSVIKYSDTAISVLNITDIKISNSGQLKCTATNTAGSISYVDRINVQGEPEIRPLENVDVVAGEDFALMCYVSGYPLPSIHWQKDGEKLTQSSKYSDFENGTLLIRDINKEMDQGRYTCVTRSSTEKIKTKNLFLKVLTKPEVVINQIASFKLNDRAVLTCVATKGDAPVKKTWLKDNEAVSKELGVSMTDMMEFSALVIPKLQPVHNGEYKCVGENVAGQSESVINIQVQTPPEWIRKPSDESARIGSDIMFHCQARGYPFPRIKWKRIINASEIDVLVSRNQKIEVMSNSSLLIRNISKEDDGQYKCDIKNGIGSGILQIANLDVRGIPDVSTQNSKIVAIAGDRVKLMCRVLADDDVTIKWTRASMELNVQRAKFWDKKLPKLVESFLGIDNVTPDDAGQYYCHANGVYGTVTRKIELSIIVPPKSLQALEIVHSNISTIRVKWSNKDPVSRVQRIILRSINGATLQNISVDPGGTTVAFNGLMYGYPFVMEVYSSKPINKWSNSSSITSNNLTFIVNNVRTTNSGDTSTLNPKSIYIAVYISCAGCFILVILIISLYFVRRHIVNKTIGDQNPKSLDKGKPNHPEMNCQKSSIPDVTVVGRSAYSNNHVYSLPAPTDTYYAGISPYATFQLPDCKLFTNSHQVELKTFSNQK